MNKFVSNFVKVITTGSFSSKHYSTTDAFPYKIVNAEDILTLAHHQDDEWVIDDTAAAATITGAMCIANGLKKDGKTRVTCYSFAKPTKGSAKSAYSQSTHLSESLESGADGLALQAARNFAKRLKLIRHPRIISFLDSVESDSLIIVATEPVIPLAQYLSIWKHEKEHSRHDPHVYARMDEIIMAGIFQIVHGIEFLHENASLVHGNLAALESSIVVDIATGDWKISGFELVFSLTKSREELTAHAKHFIQYHERYHARSKMLPPEHVGSSRRSGYEQWAKSIDCWQFGQLIELIYRFIGQGMPPQLSELQRKLVDEAPERRLGIREFMQGASMPKGIFDMVLIKTLSFVEAIMVQDTKSKQNFLVSLEQELLPCYPDTFYSSRKLLGPLIEAYHAGILDINFLGPILKLARKASRTRFDAMVVPLLLNLLDGKPASQTGANGSSANTPTAAVASGVDFTSPSQLKWIALQAMPSLLEQFTESLLSDTIYPHMMSGWKDPLPVIREWTMRVTLELITKLSPKIIHGDLLKQIPKLTTDNHPGLRTNALICLGKMVKYWKPEDSLKVLIAALIRGLTDSFPPARTAALNIIQITMALLPLNDLSMKIMPLICPLLIDPEVAISKLSFQLLKSCTDEVDRRFKERVQKADVSATHPGGGGEGEASPSLSTVNKTQLQNATNKLWFMDWALTSITDRILGSNDTTKGASSVAAPVAAEADSGLPSFPSMKPVPALFSTVNPTGYAPASPPFGHYRHDTEATGGAMALKRGSLTQPTVLPTLEIPQTRRVEAIANDGWDDNFDFDSVTDSLPPSTSSSLVSPRKISLTSQAQASSQSYRSHPVASWQAQDELESASMGHGHGPEDEELFESGQMYHASSIPTALAPPEEPDPWAD